MALKASDLVGTWSFIDWVITTHAPASAPRESRPFQPKPSGYIIYSADAVMSAVIQGGARARFPSDDVRKQPDAARARAFDSYFHYAGTWHVDGETVVHTVTAALNPNMIGTKQVRHVAFEDDRLILSAEETLEAGKGSRRHVLTWRRHQP
jgi:hypothetical protein